MNLAAGDTHAHTPGAGVDEIWVQSDGAGDVYWCFHQPVDMGNSNRHKIAAGGGFRVISDIRTGEILHFYAVGATDLLIMER